MKKSPEKDNSGLKDKIMKLLLLLFLLLPSSVFSFQAFVRPFKTRSSTSIYNVVDDKVRY